MEKQIVCPNCLSTTTEGRSSCPFCGQRFAGSNPVGSLPYGTLLGGRYTIGRYITADGEGLLYRAVENTANVRVVVKEYYPVTLSDARCADGHIEPKQGSEVLFKTNRMDFIDLYRAVQRITPAAGLVAVLDVIEENNTAYAVQETPPGMPLERYLSLRGGALPAQEACTLMQAILEGVAAMHKAGLIHRGVAPNNIFITDGGAACLAGYATLGLRTAGSELKALLYEGYSAPEQYSAAEFEGRYTDIYALGAVFYRLLTGAVPMSAAQRKVADSQHSAHAMDEKVPDYISELLDASMRLLPAERIQTVPELMGALRSQDEADEVIRRGKKRVTKPQNPQGPSRSWLMPLTTAMLVTVILILLVTVLILYYRGNGSGKGDTSIPLVTPTPASQAEILLTVPNFVGMTFDQVEKNQEYTAHFSFALVEEYSSGVPKGAVIRQEPMNGAQLGEGDSRLIQLYVSKGPELTVMPNIIGFTKENASAELTAQDIRFSMVLRHNDGQYVSDCVVETSIPAEEEFDISKEIVTVYIAGNQEQPEE